MQLFWHGTDGGLDILQTRRLASLEQFEAATFEGNIQFARTRMIDRTGHASAWRSLTMHESAYAALVFAVGDYYACERDMMEALAGMTSPWQHRPLAL